MIFLIRSFLRRWRKESGDAPLPSVAVLAYDAVSVMEAAFASLLHQRPSLFRPQQQAGNGGRFGNKGSVSCDMSMEDMNSWEHGAAIARALRSVHLPHGLTGSIRFDEDGKRADFSMDVMEMTPESRLVKVGTWSDSDGLQMVTKSFPHRGFLPKQKNFK